MILYLMRHANAGVPRENVAADARRSLIKEGKEQCALMARLMSALNVQLDTIVSSPLKRALQTAQYVGTEMGFEGRVEPHAALAPEGDFAAFQALLAQYADREAVLAVGHNPNLFKFLGRMVSSGGAAAIRMRKGSVAKVDLERHPPLLQWLIDPRMARAIFLGQPRSRKAAKPAKNVKVAKPEKAAKAEKAPKAAKPVKVLKAAKPVKAQKPANARISPKPAGRK